MTKFPAREFLCFIKWTLT